MIDLHSHTTASDGRLTPTQLVTRARAAGVTHLAITDHDTVSGLAEATRVAAELGGIEIIDGIEISTSVAGLDIHVLGHFVNPDHADLLAFTRQQEGERRARMERMVEKLNGLRLPVTMQDVEAVAGGSDNLCRPHLAEALVRRGLCTDVQQAFEWWIGDHGPAYSEHRRPTAAEAIELVHRAGGTATLAHPGADRIERHHVKLLVDQGLDGLEVFRADLAAGQEAKYGQIAKDLRLVPTAGSDFHGDGLRNGPALGKIGLDRARFDELRARRPA